MTFRELYEYGVRELREAGIEDFDFDAIQLLYNAADMTPTEFLLSETQNPNNDIVGKYTACIERRRFGEPLQYIIGNWDFLDCRLNVGKGVLIPRPETEQLARIGIETVRKNSITTVIDLCSGTGCIGISIAKACPNTKVFLLEKYEEAAHYCRINAELNAVKNVFVLQADIFDGLPEGICMPQMIISNPPYIPTNELDGLQREVQFEPVSALDGGNDGLLFYRAIAEKWLNADCKPLFCAVECGECESEEISLIFSKYGDVNVVFDVFGTDRFVCLNVFH